MPCESSCQHAVLRPLSCVKHREKQAIGRCYKQHRVALPLAFILRNVCSGTFSATRFQRNVVSGTFSAEPLSAARFQRHVFRGTFSEERFQRQVFGNQFSAASSRQQVLGNKSSATSSRLPVLGNQFSAASSRLPVLGAKHAVTRHLGVEDAPERFLAFLGETPEHTAPPGREVISRIGEEPCQSKRQLRAADQRRLRPSGAGGSSARPAEDPGLAEQGRPPLPRWI